LNVVQLRGKENMQGHSVKRHVARSGLVVLLLAMVASTLVCVKTVSVEAQSGRFIDVFTQKGGIGANQSSDMFQPQELVSLYALATYNNYPIAEKNVGFQAKGPSNPLANVTATGSSTTNESGMAAFSFRIPWPSENPEKKVLGEWHVVATVDIADQTVVDTVTFQVGWIIQITNITTLDVELRPEINYLRQSTIVFNLTVENSAKTAEPATITIDAQDSASHPIIHIQLDNLTFQPGKSHVNASAIIPADATVGQATVSAAAYTAPVERGGVLYSPAISTTFEIITKPILGHDVAITNVAALPSVANVGEDIKVTVEAANLGGYTETFNVTAYYNDSMIFVKQVTSLLPNQTTIIESTWHTSSVEAGTYRIRGEAEVVPGEFNTANNVFSDGQVTLLSMAPQRFPYFYLLILMFFLILVASLVLAIFLAILFHLRRRKKKPTQHSYVIITHPHI
jgi:hypothetical protein